jgi:flagella basal body P-ring formation protein FlgA
MNLTPQIGHVEARVAPWRARFCFLFFPSRQLLFILFSVGGSLTQILHAADPVVLQLAATAQVDSRGVFLQQIVKSDQHLPALRLCDAPEFGKSTDLTRAQVVELVATAAPDVALTNWTGTDTITISRRAHTLTEQETLDLLTATLQKDFVKGKGQLELDFTQPWDAPTVPDEPLTVKILELPTEGVTPAFIIRFELCTAAETIGTWQAPLQAHVWRNVWVAHSDLERGELISDADVDQDRRDVLGIHESLAQFSPDDSSIQLAEEIQSGNILLARNLKPRALLHRGQMADALLQDGALNIMMKVEVLEDGALGQIVRVRNPVSLRNLSGKVVNDQTVSISL